MVRTDSRARTLDSFLQARPALASAINETEAPAKRTRPNPNERDGQAPAVAAAAEPLLAAAEASVHDGVRTLLRDHVFVGCVSDELALVQHQTRLCLVNYRMLTYVCGRGGGWAPGRGALA
jgi:DNA mismatch repair protein MLH1